MKASVLNQKRYLSMARLCLSVMFLLFMYFLSAGCAPVAAPVESPVPGESDHMEITPTPTLDLGNKRELFLPTNTPRTVGSQSPTIPTVETTRPSILAAPDQQAIADLAARLRIAPEAIAVARMVEVDWPDGSVGCPQPGMRYKQVLTNGTFIQLQVGDQLYNYHSGAGRPAFLCTSPDEVVPEG